MTTCLAHPDRSAVTACSACGADLCASCEVRAHDATWCEACFAARVHGTGAGAQPPPLAPAPPAYAAPLKIPALAAIFSLLVPGLGTIYAFNGPVKRGLVQFAGWALLLWLFRHAHGLFAAVILFGWFGFYLWQAIDAHASARLVNSLGRVPSEEEAEALGRGPYLFRNADARSLGTALLVVGCVLLVVEVGGVVIQGFRWLGPIALLAAGAFIVVRARRKAPGGQGDFA